MIGTFAAKSGNYNASGEIKMVLDGLLDTGNSSNNPLDADGVFTGVAIDTLNYGIAYVSLKSDADSATNGLSVQQSVDAENWDHTDDFTITANSGKTFSFQLNCRYFRVVYTNGSAPQTFFRLQVVFKKTNGKTSTHRIQDSIIDDDDAELIKSVITAKNPSGSFVNVNSNYLGNMLVSLDEQKDAFGRLKVAEPFTIFDNSLTSALSDTLFWSTLSNGTGGGSYDNLTSKYTLTVAADGDYTVRQTKQRMKYQPAKSHEFFITSLVKNEAGVRKRIGLVDYDNVGLANITNAPQNGIFFENNAGVISWNIVNNGVVTESKTQSEWNLDKCDGTGRSRFNLNLDTTNIFTCQLEWLGVGVVIVGFATAEGNVVYCHAFMHASTNGFVDVYMRTANLPIAFEITSTGGAGSMKQICSSVISGGGFNPKGIPNAVQNPAGSAVSVSSGQKQLLVGIKLKEDSFEYSIEPTLLSIMSLANGSTLWGLSINPTYSGSVSFNDLANSNVQVAYNNGNLVTNEGIVLAKGSFSNNVDSLTQEIDSLLRIGKGLDGVRDELWLWVYAVGNESYYGTINFKDLL